MTEFSLQFISFTNFPLHALDGENFTVVSWLSWSTLDKLHIKGICVNSYLRANWKLAEVLAETFLGLSEGLLPAEGEKKSYYKL